MFKVTTILGMMLLCVTALAACQTTAPFEPIALPGEQEASAQQANATSLKDECALYEGTGILPERCGG